jgi:LysM repeat protein
MKKSSSAPARVFAFTALVAALLVLIVVVATSLNTSSTTNGAPNTEKTAKTRQPKKNVPATYLVKNGDTLTSIAHHTGVRVATIMKLNPGLDPQILISGQKIKLR